MNKLVASFRDPAGFMYKHDGKLLRQVNTLVSDDYDALMENLYPILVERNLLIPHQEVDSQFAYSSEAYKVIQPEVVPFISYPYEWSFEQLKDAALLTLRIQKIALKRGFTLKDASAYNIQFLGASPVLIDTLSFARYEAGQPWDAYRQFCEHFLAPLALAALRDVGMLRLLRTNLDGISLQLASELLPWTTRMRLGLQMHIHMHAKTQTQYEHKGDAGAKKVSVSKKSLLNIADNLQSLVQSLTWSPDDTPWHDYYEGDSYNDRAFEHKKELVRSYIQRVQPQVVWDLGANTGAFSELTQGALTIAWDFDAGAVQHHYTKLKENHVQNILPLVQDLMNPSPGVGWLNQERDGLLDRAKSVDLVMTLAFIHHIVISNNVPLQNYAALLHKIAPYAIVEFVPKSDPKVQTLLASRKDIFPDYHPSGFEQAILPFFEVVCADSIQNSERTLYLLKAK